MTTPTLEHATDRESLLAQIESLPAKRSNAALVLRICDDPSAGAAELGGAVLSDAFLTAKLLKLANSAYFGLSREIRDPAGAIGVLGFATVRALALAQLGGALEPDGVPRHFWTHSARVGAACSLLAPHSGGDGAGAVSGGEAFAIGLLHDIGRVVLVDLGAPVELGDGTGDACGGDLAAERAAAGTDHCDVGRHLCEVMELPASFGEAIRAHHDEIDASAPPHLRLIRAAILLSELDTDADDDDAADAALDEVTGIGFGRDVAWSAALALESQAAHLLAVLR